MNVFGVGMTPDLRTWEPAQRRVGSLVAIALAALFVLVGLVTYAIVGESAVVLYWVLVGLVVLVLLYEVAVLVFGMRASEAGSRSRSARATHAHGEHAATPAPVPRTPAPAHETMTLRCGDCGTVFDVTDTGERPLYHNCPGCGAEGVLRDAPEPKEAPAPAPAREPMTPKPAPAWEPTPEPAPAPVTPRPAAVTPTPAPVTPTPAGGSKRLKLRCGACKEVFAIEDTGERPLRRNCPHCGRVGEIK